MITDNKTKPMTFGSLFSGIGGFDLGFERAGMSCAWQVEIDDKCNHVLAQHWPDVSRSIRDVKQVQKGTVSPVDLICGGFPCQDVSIAGKRKGLAGERSGLWFEFHRILGELEPRWIVIENVPGLLSSNGGRDFAAILRGLVELGYGVCWRILDAQYFGVAQRRRRVFIVGYLGDGRAGHVLFERESGTWDIAPSREKRAKIARPLANSSTTNHYDESQQSYVVAQNGSDIQADTQSGALSASYAKQTSGDLIAFQSRASASNSMNPSELAPALDVAKAGGTCIAFDRTRGTATGLISAPLRACGARTSGVNDGKADAQCIAFQQRYYMRDNKPGGAPSHMVDITNCHKAGDSAPYVAGPNFAVRRLTPTECERLQGFSDCWTAGQSDTARYRQLGNAVCAPIAEWLGRRIINAERLAHEVAS